MLSLATLGRPGGSRPKRLVAAAAAVVEAAGVAEANEEVVARGGSWVFRVSLERPSLPVKQSSEQTWGRIEIEGCW